jgi:arsenate reductase
LVRLIKARRDSLPRRAFYLAYAQVVYSLSFSPEWEQSHEHEGIYRMKKNVLFICVHNSARSQMAQAFLNVMCSDYFEAQSAGLEPGTLNPLAVEVMSEVGIDISKNKTQSVFDVFKSGQLFSYVVTVCDETSAEKCPIFPGVAKSFRDPAALTDSCEERLNGTRAIRDEIRARIEAWCDEVCAVET